MTRLSEIRDNLQNTPPRLLGVIKTLLGWCDPVLRQAHNERVLLWKIAEEGLYPYRGRRPVHILADGISAQGAYREYGYVVDDYLVGLLAGDVYENILRLIEREGAPVLGARGEDEPVRDFLLRMQAWCLSLQQGQVSLDRPPLTELEQEILFVFDEREILTTIPQAVKVLRERGTGRVETTVKKAVRHLLELGLLERPQTRDGRPTRKGSRISAKGKRYLATS
ncbi:MAG TPA: hypothetical protein P5068_17670 [Sedimentisphaerales bacterium]|nr:hypothetical protein [Sedimentisphaerales bacterium]HRV49599.1 hypothetical protein [Sedimentisphaerales bacterium]